MSALIVVLVWLTAATAGAQCKRIPDCVCDQASPLVAVTHISGQDGGGFETLTIDAWAGTGADGGPVGSTFLQVQFPGDSLGRTVLMPFVAGQPEGVEGGVRLSFVDTITCGTSTFSESQALAAMVSTDCHAALFPGTTAPNQTCNDQPGPLGVFGCSTGTGWLGLGGLAVLGLRRRRA